MRRRDFLRPAGEAAGGAVAGSAAQARGVSIVLDPADAVIASAGPAQWAARELEAALTAHGVAVRVHQRLEQASPGDLCIFAAGASAPTAREILTASGVPAANAPESMWLVQGKPALLAGGSDVRGLVYALLELSDRVRHSDQPLAALEIRKPIAESPANSVRSVTRLFTSDVEDKPWYNDREMWPQYYHAGEPALQPLQPGASASATTSSARSRTPISSSPIRSCSPCRATTCACRSCPMRSATAISQMLQFISEQTVGARHGVPARPLDARL